MKCKICGKEIDKDSGRRVYCSKECSEEGNRIRARGGEKLHLEPRKCLGCGKMFTPRMKLQKYCSYKCQRRFGTEEYYTKRRIKQIAERFDFELNNFDKVMNAKKIMFDDMLRCPCDSNNPDRYCGSARCIADVVYKGHCHCSLFWYKKTPLLNDKKE